MTVKKTDRMLQRLTILRSICLKRSKRYWRKWKRSMKMMRRGFRMASKNSRRRKIARIYLKRCSSIIENISFFVKNNKCSKTRRNSGSSRVHWCFRRTSRSWMIKPRRWRTPTVGSCSPRTQLAILIKQKPIATCNSDQRFFWIKPLTKSFTRHWWSSPPRFCLRHLLLSPSRRPPRRISLLYRDLRKKFIDFSGPMLSIL